MFAPYLVDFFINDDDASFVRDLKLEILTYIASPTNIHRILREFNVLQLCWNALTSCRCMFTRRIRTLLPKQSRQ